MNCTAHCVFNKDVMKTLLTKIVPLLVALFGNYAFAQSFKHFKLKGALSELRNSSSQNRSARFSKAVNSNQKIINKVIAKKILNLDPNSKSIIEDDVPPLLQKIMDLLGTSYNQIGDEQAQPLLLSRDIGGGVKNFSGFTWQKPLANIGLWANREIAPDLFSDRWIVHDTLLVRISATTFLTNLRDEDLIDIDDTTIGTFAGISFQRTYHYYHFADSYEDGLTADYSKLFINFTKFNINHTLNLAPYELMRKQDHFSFNAGGFVSTPPAYGFNLRGGVLVNVAFENELTIQSVGEEEKTSEDEFLRVSVNKKWNIAADAHMSLQVDFFNLLKLTLLSYDLEYRFGKSNETHLSFYQSDKETILNSTEHADEFKKLISGAKDEVNLWENNIVQQDLRSSQNLNSKYSILLLGKIRKQQSEQIKVVKDGIEKVFLKHYSQSIKYIQNLWSRLFNTVIYELFKWDIGVKNIAETSKKLTVEFEQNQVLGDSRVDSESKFSLTLTQEFSASKTHRWIDRIKKSETIKHIKNWSSIEQNVIEHIQKNTLRGPISFESKVEIETEGLTFFNNLGEHEVFSIIVDVCKVKRKHKWLDPQNRKKLLKRMQVGKSACVKKLGKRYLSYIYDYYKLGFNDITKFRRFVGQFFSKSKNMSYIKRLFGEDNVFIYGQFNAYTKDKIPFSTHFKSGLFRGLGVVDNFMRTGATTVPVKLLE